MRGIVTGAMLMGLQDMGMLNVFDAVYGEHCSLCGLTGAGVTSSRPYNGPFPCSCQASSNM